MDVPRPDAKPVIALAMGDPAGISAELTAKAVALDEVRAIARLVVVGDRRVFDEGAQIARVETEMTTVAPDATIVPGGDEPLFIDFGKLDPASISRGVAVRRGGDLAHLSRGSACPIDERAHLPRMEVDGRLHAQRRLPASAHCGCRAQSTRR